MPLMDSILEWIKTNYLAIIGWIIAIISSLCAIHYRKKRSISYEEMTNVPLIKIEEGVEEEVKILYEGNEVKNVQLLRIKIINTGNDDLVKDDFNKPIIIECNEEAEIMDMSAWESNPPGIQVYFGKPKPNVATVIPDLINSKDWFICKFLINQFRNFEIKIRIKGIKDIKEYKPYFGLIYFLSMTFSMFILSLITSLLGERNFNIGLFIFLLIFSLFSGFLLWLLTFKIFPET